MFLAREFEFAVNGLAKREEADSNRMFCDGAAKLLQRLSQVCDSSICLLESFHSIKPSTFKTFVFQTVTSLNQPDASITSETQKKAYFLKMMLDLLTAP